jgi:Ca2+-binding RTX toxin-like protein
VLGSIMSTANGLNHGYLGRHKGGDFISLPLFSTIHDADQRRKDSDYAKFLRPSQNSPDYRFEECLTLRVYHLTFICFRFKFYFMKFINPKRRKNGLFPNKQAVDQFFRKLLVLTATGVSTAAIVFPYSNAIAAEGKELIYAAVSGPGQWGYNQIFVAGGVNPIPSDKWDAYVADFGYVKNGTRTAVFGGFEVLSSPGYPEGIFTYYTDTSGYTWLWNTQNRIAIYPFYQSDYPGMTMYQAGGTGSCPPGSLQVFVNWKNQPMTFKADSTVYHFITDQYENSYIMGAYSASYDTAEKTQAQFDAIVLPNGWTKSSNTLSQDITIYPMSASSGGNYEYVFNQVRDGNANNYFQFSFSKSGKSVYQMIPGMAIYAGLGDERRDGTEWPDFIHGGPGSDSLYGYEGPDSIYGDDGKDELYGGAGEDFLFGGKGPDYLDGGPGKNALTGGEGPDQFVIKDPCFGESLSGTIVDFNSSEGDKIVLSSSLFKRGLTLKTVNTSDIANYTKNKESFVYDKHTGKLYYNGNGGSPGRAKAGFFVTLSGAPELKISDLMYTARTEGQDNR